DLNRPDLQNIVTQYLQDAMRYFQRKAFFFSEFDNTLVPGWAASTWNPQGSTIQAISPADGNVYVFVALQVGAQLTGTTQPIWPNTIFSAPTQGQAGQSTTQFPPPPLPTPGVIQDNNVIWANVAQYQPYVFTNLSTVYNINQYVPPIDYVQPRL